MLILTPSAPTAAAILLPPQAGKDDKYRLSKFCAWLAGQDAPWFRHVLAPIEGHTAPITTGRGAAGATPLF